MTIYQASYESIVLSEAANLFISSVPLAIMRNDAGILFRWIDQNIAISGIALIDMPSKDDIYKTSVNTAAKKFGWEPNWGLTLRSVYQHDDRQSLVAFTKMGHQVPKPKNVSYRHYFERPMQHRCEFDPILIEYLIENFSEIGEIIIDPFCGTGTVPRIARDLGRYGIGIDQRCPFTNQE